MRTFRSVISAAVFGLAGLMMVAPGAAQEFTLYDDFAAAFIDFNKWSAFTNEGSPIGDLVRTIDNGQLRLELVSYGDKNSNTGNVVRSSGLNIRQLGLPGSITGMQARITVQRAKAKTCPINAAFSGSWISLGGVFFNDGSSFGPTDQRGNIVANLFLETRSDDSRRISYNVFRCTDVPCTTIQGLTPGFVSFTSTWTPGVPVVLQTKWQPTKNRFLFQVNPGTPGAEAHEFPYVFFDGGEPVFELKGVVVQNTTPNCTGINVRGIIDALIDSVSLKTAP